MKRLYYGISFFILVLTIPAQAQYERKVTLPISLGSSFLVSDHLFNSGVYDAGGIQFNFMLQHNLNRKFSIVWGLMGDFYFSRYNFSKKRYELKGDYAYMGLTLVGKYKFLSHQKIRPYVLGGLLMGPSIRFDSLLDLDDLDIEKVKFESPRLLAGVGLELDQSEAITYFLQLDLHRQTFQSKTILPTRSAVGFVLGMNINMFKSKSL